MMLSLFILLVSRSAWYCRVGLVFALCGVLADTAQAIGRPGIGSMPSIHSSPRGMGAINDLHRANGIEGTPAPERSGANEPVVPLKLERGRAVNALLRLHADVLEPDPQGEPMLRSQILVWSPAPATLAIALQQGFVVVHQHKLVDLDATLVVLGVPPTLSTAEALAQLRAADPQGDYDFNHIYTGSGMAPPMAGGSAVPSRPVVLTAPLTSSVSGRGMRIGLIDSGIAIAHPAFQGASIRRWGCADKPVPSAHGTAVASLILGRDRAFHGVAANAPLPATLYAADVYCGGATGGAAEQIAAALSWMASEGIGVINLSLVGPPNRTLERAVQAMLRRGHVLTAAVGNDGPNAAPLYPASYAGVVGVSAIDAARRVLPEAARGPQVMFAAPGSQMLAATVPAGYGTVRGTSFAAPIVAAMLAEKMARPNLAQAHAIITELVQHAARSVAGRTDDIGWGIVGEQFRIAPDAVDGVATRD